MAVYKINENKKVVTEAVADDYSVVTVSMDVAIPRGKSLRDFGVSGETSGKLYRVLSNALESVGLLMAGDYVEEGADNTEVYRDNGYEFFGEE